MLFRGIRLNVGKIMKAHHIFQQVYGNVSLSFFICCISCLGSIAVGIGYGMSLLGRSQCQPHANHMADPRRWLRASKLF